jgi:hypothetical protein
MNKLLLLFSLLLGSVRQQLRLRDAAFEQPTKTIWWRSLVGAALAIAARMADAAQHLRFVRYGIYHVPPPATDL